MSDVKSKTIGFRVSIQDFDTLSKLAAFFHQNGQAESPNPHLLAKKYTFVFANTIMKMNGMTHSSEQDNVIFALACGIAKTLNPGDQQTSG